MTQRIGTLGSSPADDAGRVRLFMPDGRTVLVDLAMSDADIALEHGLDAVRRMPVLNFCSGRFLDGPMHGQPDGYALNELGFQVQVAKGHQLLTYEVVALAEEAEPAELRYVGAQPRTIA